MGHARESLKVVTMGKFLEKNFSGEEIFYFLEDSAPLVFTINILSSIIYSLDFS